MKSIIILIDTFFLNIVRVVDAVLLITDAAPNAIFRASKYTHYNIPTTKSNKHCIVLYELPWQFGICAFACYLFGIAHTVSNVCFYIDF